MFDGVGVPCMSLTSFSEYRSTIMDDLDVHTISVVWFISELSTDRHENTMNNAAERTTNDHKW